jgi:phosphoglycerate dehydrogenase-like enzyme
MARWWSINRTREDTVTTTVAVLDDYQGVALAMGSWGDLPRSVTVRTLREHVPDPSELVAQLQDVDVLVAMRERTALTADVLDALPRLRLLVTTGMQNAAIDVAAAGRRGVTVCGTESDLTGTVELTWALITALARHVVAEDAALRAGGWQHTVGRGLHGQTLGLIGLGRIGTAVARVGLAFGMPVVAWSQNLTAEQAADAGAALVGKDELLETSDVVSLHLRLSDRTTGIIAAPELERMKASAFLVNTARGPLVDETALVSALRKRTIAGAGLDTYWTEPLPPGHPLLALPNTVLTPHLGYVTEQTYRLFFSQVVEDIAAWLAGSPVRVLTPATP